MLPGIKFRFLETSFVLAIEKITDEEDRLPVLCLQMMTMLFELLAK